MRIIIDTALNKGAAEYSNMGDVAMLQVAVNRLKTLWPSASIEVLTESPVALARYCPGTVALSRLGRDLWVGESFLFGRSRKYFPEWLSKGLADFTVTLEHRYPALLRMMVRMRLGIRDDENIRGNLMAFLEAMERADLLVVCGAGGFADSSKQWNPPILGILEVAARRNIPVVMLGQGMGPLNDPEILSRAKKVLPAVNLITLRGSRGGMELLESLGVPTSGVLTTGDEAIELAYEAKSEELGTGLGVNLRVASYSNVGIGFIEKLRPVLQGFARRHFAPMVSVPIAFHQWAADHLTIRQLLEGFENHDGEGLILDTPLKVIEQTGRCRIVVTGAYHAAVFALPRGYRLYVWPILITTLQNSLDWKINSVLVVKPLGSTIQMCVVSSQPLWKGHGNPRKRSDGRFCKPLSDKSS